MKFRAIDAEVPGAALILDYSGQDLSWIGLQVCEMAENQPVAYQRIWQPRVLSDLAAEAISLYDTVDFAVKRTTEAAHLDD